ncbi:MAG: DASS family sodium-coupled anion symporter [Pyrinomonadaceae bacterium]|nr:DASS family sodium-coupled anion symporter [Pyrinomonadaceae bacterium]
MKESRFDELRARAGFVIAPLAFFIVLFAPFDLAPEAHRLAAVIAAVIVLWICECVPLPVTALIGALLCVILRVAPAKEVFGPFGDPLIFLFIGSFILARAIFHHNLDRKFAFGVLSIKWIGGRPNRILFAFGIVTAVASAWLSNTATTAMMFAIGMSIISFLKDQEKETGIKINPNYAVVLMLMTSFAATIGGLMTPIGTPPNVIGLGFMRRLLEVDISFFQWMVFAAPISIVLYLFLYYYFRFLAPTKVKEIPGCADIIKREREKLGGWTRGQKSTVIAFGVTAGIWITSGVIAAIVGNASPIYTSMRASFPEAAAAILGAMLLFILPGNKKGEKAMRWSEAVKIDWGVILLFGGGFALGVLSFNTGLAEDFGRGFTSLIPLTSGTGLLIVSVFVAVLISETTSNTASANMVIPVIIAVAQSNGTDPFIPALGATLGASLGFMLPVSTPCNAIVYGSGHIPLMKMMRYGIVLDIVGAIVIIIGLSILSAII